MLTIFRNLEPYLAIFSVLYNGASWKDRLIRRENESQKIDSQGNLFNIVGT